MRLIVLHNPTSGDEDVGKRDLVSLLESSDHHVEYRSLKEDDWADVLSEPHDLIVVAGGDGSVRKAFTALRGASTTATLFPVGSANNIARTLGYETDEPARLLAGWATAARPRFDLWHVTAPWGESRCVEAVGGGVFADVLAAAEEADEEPSGEEKVDFGLQLVHDRLTEAEAAIWRLELDGKRHREQLLGIEAMNVREIGPNLPLAPYADVGDGRLDVVLVRLDDRVALLEYLRARLRDEAPAPPVLECLRAAEVVLQPPEDARIHVDDLLPAWHEKGTRWVRVAPADTQVQVVVPGGSP